MGTIVVIKKPLLHWPRRNHPGDPAYSPSSHDGAGGHLTFAETGALVTGAKQLANLTLV